MNSFLRNSQNFMGKGIRVGNFSPFFRLVYGALLGAGHVNDLPGKGDSLLGGLQGVKLFRGEQVIEKMGFWQKKLCGGCDRTRLWRKFSATCQRVVVFPPLPIMAIFSWGAKSQRLVKTDMIYPVIMVGVLSPVSTMRLWLSGGP